MIRTVHLHGALAEFGGPFRFDVRSPVEATSALIAHFPRFKAVLRKMRVHVFRGPMELEKTLDEEQVKADLGRATEIHIVPEITGRGGRGGFLKLLAGLSLVALSFLVPAGGIALGSLGGVSLGTLTSTQVLMTGISFALSGVSALLAPQPKVQQAKPAQENSSFLFNNAENTADQGAPIPLVYGRFLVGGIVASAGFRIEQIKGGGKSSRPDITVDGDDVWWRWTG